MEDIVQTPKLSNIEQVSDGWLKKYVLTYDMPDGSQHLYEAVSRKGIDEYRSLLEANAAGAAARSADAVSIVAKTPRGTLVMIREFRYPLNSWCISFPAGLVDAGEDMASSVHRELLEETGYGILEDSEIRPLPQAGYSSTGMSDETVQVVYVDAEKIADASPEPNELIEIFELPIADIRRFLDENTLPIGARGQLILEGFIH